MNPRVSNFIETEIKLAIPDGAEHALRLLHPLGYRPRTQRLLQIDQVFDRPDGALRNSRELLRLRSEAGRGILTYKGPPLPSRHKSREELESPVADSAALELILDRLGFAPSFRYEKYRTVFSRDEEGPGRIVALDETPIGVFLELEGPEDWIDETALRLGFAAAEYITASYATLYREFAAVHGGPSDMTFEYQHISTKKQP